MYILKRHDYMITHTQIDENMPLIMPQYHSNGFNWPFSSVFHVSLLPFPDLL